MSRTIREPTSVSYPMSAASLRTSSPAFSRPAPPSPLVQSSHPHLAQLANAGLSAGAHGGAAKLAHSPRFRPIPLTGAAAMEDNRAASLQESRKHERQLQTSRTGDMTSPNPARTALMSLHGSHSLPVSKLGGGPRPTVDTAIMSALMTDPMHLDITRPRTPTVQSPLDMDAPVQMMPDSAVTSSKKRPASPRAEERSIKALTYPPQLGQDDDSPDSHRNMTYPGSSSLHRSPSTSSKKHKCLHCSTEFTRHHNLKSHLLTHSQEKPYGCQQCASRFRRLHDLKRHIKLHTGERTHICNKCGRKFARGDALARHNKGPGGCAGRRGSGGEGDDFNDEGELDPSMEGISYSGMAHDSGEEAHVGEDQRDANSHGPHDQGMSTVGGNISGSYRQHSSTYPGIAPTSRGFYPPQQSSQVLDTSPREGMKRVSPQPAPGPITFPPSIYAQSGITESPRPLSPRQPEIQRGPPSSVTSQVQREIRGTGSNVSQSQALGSLPSLAMLAGESRYPPLPQPGQVSSAYPQHNSSTSTIPSGGSNSPHGKSSASNMRDILHGDPMAHPLHTQQYPDALLDYVKSLERRMEEQSLKYEAEITRLKDEVITLKVQQQRTSLPLPNVSVA